MSFPPLDDLLQHTASLRRLARELVGDAGADDVLQDAAIEAMTAPLARPGQAIGWLVAVVRNLARKRRRGERIRARHEQLAGRGEEQAADRTAEAADSLRRLTEVVTALPEPYRSTLFARYLRERTPSEIAAETGVPVRTVKTRLQRGLQMLRERLDDRHADWRAGLVAAFGLETIGSVATTTVSTTAATAAGILFMTTTTKTVLAAAALLLAGVIAWQFVAPDGAASQAHAVDASAGVVAGAPVLPSPGNQDGTTGEVRTAAVPPPAPPATQVPGVTNDEVLVRVVDAETGAPVVDFGLRASMAPENNLMQPEIPLLHAGVHAEGRLVLPLADFEQRTFLVEDKEHRYLPSAWFGLADAVARDGVRSIEVKLPLPVEVTLTVVREHGGAPVAGTKVELLRPWRLAQPVELATNVQSSTRFRAQSGESDALLKMIGGRALLLVEGETDAGGKVRLRVPPDEVLALRLLGPGHRPVVRQPWRVARSAQPIELTESVTSGGSIQGRVVPLELLSRLGLESIAAGVAVPAPMVKQFVTGLRLRHKGTGESIPPAQAFFEPRTPLADDGTFTMNGLAAGDWQWFFSFPYVCQEPEARLRGTPLAIVSQLGTVEYELPAIDGLADHELRVIDVDVSQFLPGQLDVGVTRDGQPVHEGALLVRPLAGVGASTPKLRSQPNLRCGENGRFVANLPPARYAVGWTDFRGKPATYLGTCEVRSGTASQVDFVAESVSGAWRIVEADGATPANGSLQLTLQAEAESSRWGAYKQVDTAGLAEFDALPRDAVLQAKFTRTPPAVAAGAVPQPVTPIDLGTVSTAGLPGAPRVLRLPPR